MNLYLMRHGKTILAKNGEHTLSDEGKRETAAVAQLLKQKKVEIDELIHSQKLRTKETAEIVRDIAAADLTIVQGSGLNPDDSIEPFLAHILPLDRNLMVVTHLPLLDKIVDRLAHSTVDFCCSCIACLEESEGSWQVKWTLSPENLKGA